MKAIIIAAGRGTRMGPVTLGHASSGVGISKGLVPIFDKLSISYPVALLISAGIREIQIIGAPDNVNLFQSVFDEGDELGIELSYAVQHTQRGIADAFIIGADFIGNDDVALTFCDNIFIGSHLTKTLRSAASISPRGAKVFAKHVANPHEYGVVEFDENRNVLSLEEKPENPKSNFAVPGMYFYSPDVVEIASMIKPSARGELEITTVNEIYLDRGLLDVTVLDRDTEWFDTGNSRQAQGASDFVRNHQDRTGRLIGSPEAEAYLSGFIDKQQLLERGVRLEKSDYGQALIRLAETGWDM